VRGGDCIKVDFDATHSQITFLKEAESLPVHLMAELADQAMLLPNLALANAAAVDLPKPANAKRRAS